MNWILCKDKVPVIIQCCLVTQVYIENCKVKRIVTAACSFPRGDGKCDWIKLNCKDNLDNILAWSPMPEPCEEDL